MDTKASVIHWNNTKLELHKLSNTTDCVGINNFKNDKNENGPASPPLIIPLSEHIDLGAQESYCFDVKIEVQPAKKVSPLPEPTFKVSKITKPKQLATKKASSNNGENRQFKCSTCSKAFATRQHLTRHTNLHSMETLYPCQKCDKVCLDRSYLLRHMRVHESDKKFVCNICGKRFRSVTNLKRHTTNHDQSLRQFQCLECGKRFPDNSSLKKHSLGHSGVKTHICTICAKGFSYVGDLNMHMKGHDQMKEYRCSDCGREFSRHSNLVRHRAVHSDNGIFQCTFCKVSFQHAATLTRHLLSSHPGHVKVKKKTVPPADISGQLMKTESSSHINAESSNDTNAESNFNCTSDAQVEQNDARLLPPQPQISLLPSSPSPFEIYQIDNSGSLVRINALSIQSLQLLNNQQPSSGLFQMNTYSGA